MWVQTKRASGLPSVGWGLHANRRQDQPFSGSDRMNRRFVLMICYYFPPLTDVGCRRSVAFSKYFKKHGWEPVVLSVKNPDKFYCSVGDDRPPEGIRTYYSLSLLNVSKVIGKMNGALTRLLKFVNIEIDQNYPRLLLCHPDRFFGWIPLAVLKGLKLIKKHQINMVYVSCRPFSAALVGIWLKKIFKIPLILDFRDPFALDHMSFLKIPEFRKRINRKMERYFLKNADLFLVTSRETKDAYVDQYPEIENKILTIYNGFDPEMLTKSSSAKKFEKFTIIYAGQFYFYAQQNEIFTEMFFRGLHDLKSRGEIDSENFQFLYYGDGGLPIAETAARHRVSDLVLTHSRVPYEEALNLISRSHLMLLRIVKLMITTKLYEGIPLEVPFLATIPHGEVEEIIREYHPGSYVISEEHTHADVAEAILDAKRRYNQNDIRSADKERFLDTFSRENMTIRLMDLVEEKIYERCFNAEIGPRRVQLSIKA